VVKPPRTDSLSLNFLYYVFKYGVPPYETAITSHMQRLGWGVINLKSPKCSRHLNFKCSQGHCNLIELAIRCRNRGIDIDSTVQLEVFKCWGTVPLALALAYRPHCVSDWQPRRVTFKKRSSVQVLGAPV